ncbi:MAG: LysR family transcriptional regulator [Notoacmeibacter sp.]|nr:LysR family transcriptional regulator [Notoacmeibacter sp.]
MLTLRQIEVIRAIMVTGTMAGAARLLNVSQPGISRLMKYTEDSIGVRLFDRTKGRLVPTAEAKTIFNLLDSVYGKVEDLQFAIASLRKGAGTELSIASVPSIGNVMMPRAVKKLRSRFPALALDIDILKIEEALDYLLLGRGEVVALSHRVEHSVLAMEPLVSGRLLCVVPEHGPLASRTSISPEEMASHPLIGINPNDPYGRIMAAVFSNRGLDYSMTIKARFGSTVCRLVAEGLGIAIIDEFTLAHDSMPGIAALEISAETSFQTFAAYRNDRSLSVHAEQFIHLLREEMAQVAGTPSGKGHHPFAGSSRSGV